MEQEGMGGVVRGEGKNDARTRCKKRYAMRSKGSGLENCMGESPDRRAGDFAEAMRANRFARGRTGGRCSRVATGIRRLRFGKERKSEVIEVERRPPSGAPGAAGQGVLLLAVHQDPFGDARLDVDLNEFVQDVDQFLSEIGALVQAGQLKRLQRDGGAGGEVLEHWLAGLHAGPPAATARIGNAAAAKRRVRLIVGYVHQKVTVLISVLERI